MQSHVYNLTQSFARLGHEVRVVTKPQNGVRGRQRDGNVDVAHHRVGGHELAGCQLHAPDRSVGPAGDARDGRPELERRARLLCRAREPARYLMHAPVGEVHARDHIHVLDDGVDGERLEG